MKETDLSEIYVTYNEAAEETGVSRNTVSNWVNYHRYFDRVRVLGKPVLRRTEFDKFKFEHPELIQAKQVA